ncbi:hypothetical protein [Actinomadura rudentiformis]|uniref:DUF1449 family protein n=1 Tax=Actinomadura rudentiformis TaxID=359158 RepID=A0A6H9ZCC1_9ACTN|nr:hypothetical protein [Actinomadura rudentiformis]KAB2352199.1 hypothetical protein F8566_00335 [Actinomadura rudentiformis]
MAEFLDIVLGFPTALFTFPLLVVAGYWLLVLVGGVGAGDLGADVDTGADIGAEDTGLGGPAGVLGAAGLGGVPVTVVLSLLIGVGWFASLVGSVLAEGAGDVAAVLSFAVLVIAFGVAWAGTRLLVLPLRPIFRRDAGTTRRDLVGRMCVIRTGRVDSDFGQAEVITPDGSTVLVQVRRPPASLASTGAPVAGATFEGDLTHGTTALIFDYEPAGEFFLVMPYDAAFDPDGSVA